MSQMHVDAPQSICGNPAEPIPEQLDTSHAALPRTHHEEAEQQRCKRRRRGMVNTQRPRKEILPEIFSGHVAPASYAHEQVTSTKTTEQATEEAAGHSTGHQ
jgi:hypothetical protein